MVGQVAALYPVRVFREPLLVAENHRSDANGEDSVGMILVCMLPINKRALLLYFFVVREITDIALPGENGALPHENGHGTTHLVGVIKSPQVRHFTFFGWQIGKHKPEQQSYSHKELQRSAAVLGYAAHVSLPSQCSRTTKY
jgi:hypothetical protein